MLNQLSYDQGAVRVRNDTSFSVALAVTDHVVVEGKMEILSGLERISYWGGVEKVICL